MMRMPGKCECLRSTRNAFSTSIGGSDSLSKECQMRWEKIAKRQPFRRWLPYPDNQLLVIAQRLNRVQAGGFEAGEDAGEDADTHAETESQEHGVQRDDGCVGVG